MPIRSKENLCMVRVAGTNFFDRLMFSGQRRVQEVKTIIQLPSYPHVARGILEILYRKYFSMK